MKLNLALLFIASSLLVGCGDSTPKCNSDDAKSLVVDISKKQIKKQFDQLRNSQMSGMVPKDADNIKLDVINVRTVMHDSSLDTYTCSADLKMTLPEKANELPITYNIQKTDDSNGQFYINVFGL
ncbi:TPA: hypothetical protein U5E00_004330 [Yersinia enterocolitica]|uniref:hypothetical protein n=1 Tax=Yersinia enterocolitica TaxID=630 RepID=UPI0021E79293|nr:hypothetical protein [Yersinia enterocolitica]EMA9490383.1 hypothetical protein [Yersinia enterocolitica]UYJ84124.1 hypothetical protein N4W04_16440 [Yersinia enterocolitica]UYK13502.1 hypothetical protein N4224_16460 [Yersinia enterocolitica]HEN3585229.1 hypothetical protein [Yersinia enterocolitica]